VVRVPRGLHSPSGSYAPGRLRWGPAARPAARLPVQLYQRKVSGLPLIGGQGQATVSAAATMPTIVQGPVVIPGALSGSLPNPTTAGNSVVAITCAFSTTNGLVPSVSGVTLGGGADHFANAATTVSPYNSAYMIASIWTDPGCAGGQTAVAVSGSNLTVNVDFGIILYEVSGVLTSGVVDQASSGNSSSGTTWSSGTAPTTTVADEIWFGADSLFGAGTQPAGWVNSAFASNGIGGGYQIVNATGAPLYSGGQGVSGAWAAVVVALKGVASTANPQSALISVGPQGIGNVWYPASCTIQTTSGVNDFSTCQIFLGPAGIPVTLQATIFPGGYGTASLAIPSMTPGQYIIARWTNANPGDLATINVVGTMDSVQPG
jgi:hypothetical protein